MALWLLFFALIWYATGFLVNCTLGEHLCRKEEDNVCANERRLKEGERRPFETFDINDPKWSSSNILSDIQEER